MANVGIVKSKNSNHEKTPVGGFFLGRFFSISIDFSAEAEKANRFFNDEINTGI